MKKKYPKLEEGKKEANKYREKAEKEMKAQIRRMDLELLRANVEMRKSIFEKIQKIYEKDLLLLQEAEEKLAIYLGEETTKEN